MSLSDSGWRRENEPESLRLEEKNEPESLRLEEKNEPE